MIILSRPPITPEVIWGIDIVLIYLICFIYFIIIICNYYYIYFFIYYENYRIVNF